MAEQTSANKDLPDGQVLRNIRLQLWCLTPLQGDERNGVCVTEGDDNEYNEINNESLLHVCNRLCPGSYQISYHFKLFLNAGASEVRTTICTFLILTQMNIKAGL